MCGKKEKEKWCMAVANSDGSIQREKESLENGALWYITRQKHLEVFN